MQLTWLPYVQHIISLIYARDVCTCTNKDVVQVSATPCGVVLKTHTFGACWKTAGLTKSCSGYLWIQIIYTPEKKAWVKSTDMVKSSDDKCQGIAGDCKNVRLVTRSEWGARTPRNSTDLCTPLSMVFIHHTAMARCYNEQDCKRMVKKIQNFHMDQRGFDDIGYNFIVGDDGNVYMGRGWGLQGAQCLGHNQESFGISIMGDFTSVLPSDKALQAVKDIIACGVDKGALTTGFEVFGHRDGRCTECPGDALYAHIQTWPGYSHRNITRICP